MTGIPFTQTETCMMYQKQTDKNLISVMNKSIGSVSEEEQNEVIRHYSASLLNMLKEAPIDEIKLDMRFLSKDDLYGRAEDILHMIIAMGNSMRLSVLAEGVETEKQKEMLQNFCCNKAQGYYYAKPMKAQDSMLQSPPLTGGPVADGIRNKSKKIRHHEFT